MMKIRFLHPYYVTVCCVSLENKIKYNPSDL